ncbi:histidinol-phosphate transaminase [Spirochaeta africana]|uniref:Histidinol-phosphate aminotransferase n=1 Tax=Spirochaeta africana (strain ATCC 700263 / DSM 8902 / Z-7692) TaxID=889378 RepID=H9UHR8_SPIAZ|nr:histidinol-phosphate transaminase [Spirochaeta africana]AFG37061.1 histidinol-phosphate aminotransferase [Spirochaeta africana DSM 8902]
MNTQRPVPRTSLSLIPAYHPGKRSAGTIKLSSNENPLGYSPDIIPALLAAAGELEVYPDGRGTALIEALAEHHGIPGERIILGNGSDDIMIMAAAAFLEPGTNAVMATPTFSQYEFASRLYGAEVRQVPLIDGNHDLDGMLSQIDTDTRIVWVCNPNNPTGTYRSQAELQGFLQQVPPRVLVILDEAYSEYATAPDYPASPALLNDYPNLVVLHTFSKIYGLAALRLGYGFADPDIIRCFLRVKQPFNVNGLALAAGVAALQDRDFVERSLQVNHDGMQYLTGVLDELNLQYYPSQANFICVTTPVPAQQACTVLQQHGVTVRSLQSFGLDNAIRISIGEMAVLKKLAAGLRKLSSTATE